VETLQKTVTQGEGMKGKPSWGSGLSSVTTRGPVPLYLELVESFHPGPEAGWRLEGWAMGKELKGSSLFLGESRRERHRKLPLSLGMVVNDHLFLSLLFQTGRMACTAHLPCPGSDTGPGPLRVSAMLEL
jgi:hypothetical protein